MYKYFFKPMKTIFVIYILGGLSIVANIAQLTSFNAIEVLKDYSPQSYCFLIAGTLLLYIVLVIRNAQTEQLPAKERNAGQVINTGNVKNSTIIQIKQEKEG